jgi:hypothetical protein
MEINTQHLGGDYRLVISLWLLSVKTGCGVVGDYCELNYTMLMIWQTQTVQLPAVEIWR